ncbi:unnamed protein product [Urochloa humidicola]
MRFTAREIEFMGQPTKVLACNNKVASALTSLSNYFLLKNEFSLASYDAKTRTMESFLEMCISRRALDCYKRIALESPVTKAIMQDFFDITVRLKTGIELNPVAGTTAFDASRESEFFDTMGVTVLHATAFNEQVFPTLQQQLHPGQIAILYLNEEFNTICEYNGTIYMLVEDETLHRNNPFSCWKTVVNQKDIFVASDFSYITASIDKKLHKCLRCSKEFCTEINYERHLETHVPAYKDNLNILWSEDTFVKLWDRISDEDAVSILSTVHQTIERTHGLPVESIIKKWIISPEFRETPPEVKQAMNQLKNTMGTGTNLVMGRGKPPSVALLGILKVGSEGTFMSTNLARANFSYVEADKTQNTVRSMLTYFSMGVEELMAKKWYADKLVESDVTMKQLMEDNVASMSLETSTSSHVSDDVVSAGKVQDDEEKPMLVPSKGQEKKQPKLVPSKGEEKKLLPSDISHLPELDGEEYFPNFVSRKMLVRIFTLFNKDKVTGLTRSGRRFAKRLLKYILKVHKSGHCWNGEWDILDIRVRGDGAEFSINKTQIESTRDGIVADLQKFIVLLYPYYKIEGIKGPAYFDEFHSDVMALPNHGSEEFEKFLKFVADHMVFMPPLARSDLLERLFRLCDDIRQESGDYIYRPLSQCVGWTGIRSIMPYNKVFFYDMTAPKPYRDHYWDLLRFVRNFLNHALKYTKINGVQTVEDVAILDLMLAHDLGKFITKLVLLVLYGFQKPDRLVSTWVAYRTSDDATEENDEDENEMIET